MRTPHSEDEIRAVTIGELKPLSSPTATADYDPVWQDLFQCEAGRIRAVPGATATRVEHGFDVRAGPAAKPIIDTILAVWMMFRDWLRPNEDGHALEARTKLALAKKRWTYPRNFADARTAVVEETMAQAERYHQELRAAST